MCIRDRYYNDQIIGIFIDTKKPIIYFNNSGSIYLSIAENSENGVMAVSYTHLHCKTHIRRSEKRNWLEHEYYLHTDKTVSYTHLRLVQAAARRMAK